ncbi:hypothetical protein Prudu_020281, partial [Prunus dulcis]
GSPDWPSEALDPRGPGSAGRIAYRFSKRRASGPADQHEEASKGQSSLDHLGDSAEFSAEV